VDAVTIMLSVVVPVHNEAGVIEQLISDLGQDIVAHVPGTEVIVVDDASTDETEPILARLSEERPWLHVHRASRNAGHGPSVTRGLRLALGEWIFQIDSDGQFVVAEFHRLWEQRENCDLILGVRVERQDPFHRLVLSRAVCAVVSLLVGRRLRDPNIPFRLLRRTVWDELAPLVGPETLAPSIHVVVGAVARGRRVEEVPVTHLPRARGTSSLRRIRLVRFSLVGLVQLARFRYAVTRNKGANPAALSNTW
jgi:dolichol-phosphate mannosyltransferase